jgi:C4-dicarboxylate-specific signal transduction histidine kinase
VVAPRVVFVLADKVQIQQVLLNLMRNAIEAMDRGAPCFRDSRSQISKLLALGVGCADDEKCVPS